MSIHDAAEVIARFKGKRYRIDTEELKRLLTELNDARDWLRSNRLGHEKRFRLFDLLADLRVVLYQAMEVNGGKQ